MPQVRQSVPAEAGTGFLYAAPDRPVCDSIRKRRFVKPPSYGNPGSYEVFADQSAKEQSKHIVFRPRYALANLGHPSSPNRRCWASYRYRVFCGLLSRTVPEYILAIRQTAGGG